MQWSYLNNGLRTIQKGQWAIKKQDSKLVKENSSIKNSLDIGWRNSWWKQEPWERIKRYLIEL